MMLGRLSTDLFDLQDMIAPMKIDKSKIGFIFRDLYGFTNCLQRSVYAPCIQLLSYSKLAIFALFA